MKKCLATVGLSILLCTLMILSVAAEYIPYTTYTYSTQGKAQESPHAYAPIVTKTSFEGLDIPLKEPTDIVKDSRDRLYIADTGNDRIVVLNPDLSLCTVISQFKRAGATDSLSAPRGVFVADDGTVYISDTNHQRILSFDSAFVFQHEITRPETVLLDQNYDFHPQSLVVDKVGRLFVCCESINQGIMVLDKEGNLKNFFGAQKVQTNPIEIFWRRFMTDEQIARTTSFVPTEYNSINIDAEGFLFVTSSAIDATLQYAATVGRDTSDRYAPVKRFGAAGADVLRRKGSYPPSGDVSVSLDKGGPSRIVDCLPGAYGTYTLLDSVRNKLFTYDPDGNLLFAFGGTGSQLGLFEGLCAGVTLSDARIVCTDKINNSLTLFSRTEYGDLIFKAMELHSTQHYSEEPAVWQQILLKNNNLDYAYIGLGKSMMKNGDYQQAMAMFRNASDKALYSEAYKEYRKQQLSSWMLLIPVVVIVCLIFVGMFFSWVKRYNRSRIAGGQKRTFTEQILFGFYVIFHPFDGFWDLHHENRGSLLAGLTILGGTMLMVGFNTATAGYLYRAGMAFWISPLIILLFVALFVASNWSLTSLMDGNGTAKQILTTTCYSLLPLLLMQLPQLVLSHVLTLSESSYMAIFQSAGYVWTAFILFCGILTTHRYSFGKAVLTVICTLIGMVLITFLALMFFNLMEPMVNFFVDYYKEVLYRL